MNILLGVYQMWLVIGSLDLTSFPASVKPHNRATDNHEKLQGQRKQNSQVLVVYIHYSLAAISWKLYPEIKST